MKRKIHIAFQHEFGWETEPFRLVGETIEAPEERPKKPEREEVKQLPLIAVDNGESSQ